MGKFMLDGTMIPRSFKRVFDGRSEPRIAAESQTAVLHMRGNRHVVRLVNISPSGAMVMFKPMPHIGELVTLQLLGRDPVQANVRWVRDGHIGVNFVAALE